MPNLAQEWAANLDEKGGTGSDMQTPYLGKLKAVGQVAAYDWSADLSA